METQTCPICGKEFSRIWYPKGWGPIRTTCSRACGGKLRATDVGERFWSHVDQSGGPDACWPWMGSMHHLGYGQFSLDGKVQKAHRVAFFLEHGHWSKDDTLHRCDNRPCCNPAHLFDGTHAENMADMKAKGRRKGVNTGADNGRAVLTMADAREIRRLLHSGLSQQAVANQYGIHQTQVSRIKLNQVWAEPND